MARQNTPEQQAAFERSLIFIPIGLGFIALAWCLDSKKKQQSPKPQLGQQSYGPHPGYTEPAMHPDMPAHQIPRHRPQGRGAPPGQIARVQHHYFGGYETD